MIQFVHFIGQGSIRPDFTFIKVLSKDLLPLVKKSFGLEYQQFMGEVPDICL